jgi:hypothetical protein
MIRVPVAAIRKLAERGDMAEAERALPAALKTQSADDGLRASEVLELIERLWTADRGSRAK